MLIKLGLVTGIYEQEYIDIVNVKNEIEEKNLRDDHWFPEQTSDQFESYQKERTPVRISYEIPMGVLLLFTVYNGLTAETVMFHLLLTVP